MCCFCLQLFLYACCMMNNYNGRPDARVGHIVKHKAAKVQGYRIARKHAGRPADSQAKRVKLLGIREAGEAQEFPVRNPGEQDVELPLRKGSAGRDQRQR